MNIKENCSIFTFRPPGVLKSSVNHSKRLRHPLIPAYERQNLNDLGFEIDPHNNNLNDILTYIPEGNLFLSILENAYFIVQEGFDGVVITNDLQLIDETLHFCKNQSLDQIKIDLNDAQLLEEIFLAFDPKWMQYDHWMGYCLSKSYLANLYTPTTMKIAIPEYRNNNIFIGNSISRELYDNTLEKAKLNSRTIFLKDGIYKAKKLALFHPNSHYPYDHFNFHDTRRIFNFINKNSRYKNDLPTNFLIATNQKNQSCFSDHFQSILIQTCNELNLPIIHLENMDWESQIALFSQAEFIIAPHCPELINLYFCQKDTTLLELTSFNKNKSSISCWPFLIASTNNINYCFIDMLKDNINIEFFKNTVRNVRAL